MVVVSASPSSDQLSDTRLPTSRNLSALASDLARQTKVRIDRTVSRQFALYVAHPSPHHWQVRSSD